MKDIQVRIPNPCSQGWDSMTEKENGRHCSSCDKIVVDFTLMSDEEIKTYFKKNYEQRTCGHFLKTQLKSEKIINQHYLYKIKNRFQNINFTPVRNVSLFLIGLLISLSSCNQNTVDETEYNDSKIGQAINVDSTITTKDTITKSSKVVKDKEVDSIEMIPVVGEVYVEDL